MDASQRIPAFLAYLLLPVGWLYVLIFQRRNALAIFHCKQSIVLVGWLVISLAAWAALGWVLAWVPLGFVIGVALFGLVIAAYIFAFIAWVVGMRNALSARMVPLPIVGGWAIRLMP